MSNIDKIRQEIERLKQMGSIGLNEYDAGFENGRGELCDELLAFIDSLPEEASCIYDTNELTPTPSVNIEDVARVQFASHAHVFDRKRKAVFDWEQFKEVAGIFYGFSKRDSLPEDDIPKIEGWIARNKDESLVFCYHKPHRENSITQEWWGSCDADFRIYDDTIDEQFKDLKWEDEPVRVEIAVKRLDSLPEDHFRDSTKMVSKEQEEEIPLYCTGVKGDPDPPGINDLEEAAEDSWMLYEYRETPQGLYSSCYRDGFIAGAKWMESQMPMPEDTVIFIKGVAEGRRLEREDMTADAVVGFVCGRVKDHINVHVADGINLTPPGVVHIPADKSKYKVGDKVEIVILKKDK